MGAGSETAGAKYLILVAKHHDGFALWPTAQSEYSVKNSPWMGGKGDVVKLTAAAVRQQGMGFESTFRRGIVMSRSMPMLMPTISFTRRNLLNWHRTMAHLLNGG